MHADPIQNEIEAKGLTAPRVTPANFDAEIGRKIARQNAVNKIWPLLGFSLRDAIVEAKTKRAPRYRCAETGEYVTRGYAEAHPATTVKEG